MRRTSRQLAGTIILVAVIGLLFLGRSLAWSMASIPELFVLLLVPLVVGTLLWFVWSVFIYKYWRANHIRRLRDRRELRDATMR